MASVLFSILYKIISEIISPVPEAALKKARSYTAGKFKDGDITSEKLQSMIFHDLDEITRKIDGLARKDLLASYSSLRTGIKILILALDDAKDERNVDKDGRSKTTETTTRNGSESKILNEAIELSAAIRQLKNTSNDRLDTAKEYFRKAGEKATEAFCNDALSLSDKIMATELRVASMILESLQDTKLAASCSLLFLEELRDLPAVGETMSTYFKGGIKSWVYKESRLKNVISVLSLNLDVSEFIARFSSELHHLHDVYTNWPRIHLPTRETIHPLVIDPFTVDIYSEREYLVKTVMRPIRDVLVGDAMIMSLLGVLPNEDPYRLKVEMARQAFMKNRARVWHIINISPSEISANVTFH